MEDTSLWVAFLGMLVLIVIVVEEARISEVKKLLKKRSSARLPHEHLLLLLLLYQHKLVRTSIRGRDLEKAFRHLFDVGLIKTYNPNIVTLDHLQDQLINQKLLTNKWFSIPAERAELRELMKDKVMVEKLLKEFKGNEKKNNNGDKT